jgi:hypothetical protein
LSIVGNFGKHEKGPTTRTKEFVKIPQIYSTSVTISATEREKQELYMHGPQ